MDGVSAEDGYDPDDLDEYSAAVAALERAAAGIPLDRPWAASEARALDAMTLETWLDGRLDRPGARTMLATTVANLFAAEPASLSLLHVLFYVRSGGGWESITSTEGGAQQDRLVGGLQEPAVRLAARLGDAIRLEWPVRAISQDSGGVVVAGEAGEVRARRAIVAIPPTLAGRLVYHPALPGGRDELAQRLPGGSVVKFNLVYPTPWWRELGQRGFVYSPDEPVSMMFDATPAEGEPGVIVGFMEGAKGVEAAALSAAERRELVIEQAERALGPPAAAEHRLRRSRLERRGMDQGLLWRALPARSLDPARTVASRARWSHPLGRHGNRAALDGLRRRRNRIRHQSSGRGTRRLLLARRNGKQLLLAHGAGISAPAPTTDRVGRGAGASSQCCSSTIAGAARQPIACQLAPPVRPQREPHYVDRDDSNRARRERAGPHMFPVYTGTHLEVVTFPRGRTAWMADRS